MKITITWTVLKNLQTVAKQTAALSKPLDVGETTLLGLSILDRGVVDLGPSLQRTIEMTPTPNDPTFRGLFDPPTDSPTEAQVKDLVVGMFRQSLNLRANVVALDETIVVTP